MRYAVECLPLASGEIVMSQAVLDHLVFTWWAFGAAVKNLSLL